MNVRITDIDGKKPSFVQWDVDRVLYIEGCDSQPCLHFANPMLTRAIVVEAEEDGSRWICRVPNIILQTAAPIVISVFIQPDEGKTVLTDWVKVQPKMKPQDYTYEENIGYTNWVQKTQEAEEILATLEETCDQAQDLVEDIQGKLDRKELQGNSIWTTTETPMPATGGYAFTQLTGRSSVPPIVGDIIVRSSRYVYEVVEVTSGGVVIGHQIGDIRGAQGVADAIWRTTASIGSVYPFGYVVNVSDLVGRSGATPKAGDLVLGPESGQTGDPTYLYTISGVGSSTAGLDGIGSIKGATGATGPQGPGVTEDLRAALLQLAQKVAYVDEHGADYYQDLYNALYLPSDIVFITAVFDQGTTKVMDTDSLDSLKPMLTVFGRYDDNTSVVLTNYTLTGVLTPGTSTVTVSALGKTTTFDVLVTGMTSISAVYTQSGTVYDTDALDSLKADLVVTAHYSDSSTQTVPAADCTLSGTLTVGTSTITVAYGGKTTTFNVTVTDSEVPAGYTRANYIENPTQTTRGPMVGTGVTPSTTGSLAVDIDFMMTQENTYAASDGYKYIFAVNVGTGYATAGCCIGVAPNNYDVYAFNEKTATIEPNGTSSVLNKRLQVTAEFTPTSVSITDGTLSDNASSTGRNHGQPIYFFGLKTRPGADYQFAYYMIGRIYGCTVRDNGTEILKAIPCVRNSDDAVGFWDVVNENFITANNLVAG